MRRVESGEGLGEKRLPRKKHHFARPRHQLLAPATDIVIARFRCLRLHRALLLFNLYLHIDVGIQPLIISTCNGKVSCSTLLIIVSIALTLVCLRMVGCTVF